MVFQTSCTVGELLTSMPQKASCAEQLERIDVADVRDVESDRSPDGIAGHLNEGAEIAVDAAGVEAGDLLGDEIVVGLQSRRLAAGVEAPTECA